MDSLEILKASVPFATITGVVVGSLLNSRLSRRDKILDHLFTYRVKAYSELAQSILVIKRDFDVLIQTMFGVTEVTDVAEKMTEISKFFQQKSTENMLFLSTTTREDLKQVNDVISRTSTMVAMRYIHPEMYNSDDFINKFFEVIYVCDNFLNKLQKDLEIYKLDSKKKKLLFWK